MRLGSGWIYIKGTQAISDLDDLSLAFGSLILANVNQHEHMLQHCSHLLNATHQAACLLDIPPGNSLHGVNIETDM